jgi:Sulfotransferase family
MKERATLLYILAPSFSGSTLLTYLLAQHPRIATIGELKATKMGDVAEYRCSCGALIGECGFWKLVAMRCEERGIPFALDKFDTVLGSRAWYRDKLIRGSVRGRLFEALRGSLLALSPGTRHELGAQIRHNYELSRTITEIQGGEIFLDGSKGATRLLHFIRSCLWDVRVIYLQRDGRGVVASIMKHRGVGFERAAEEWLAITRELEHLRRMLPEPIVVDLKYEALCRQPRESLERIFKWLEIDGVAVSTEDFKAGDFHILGNTMRLNGISEIRLDEGWRSKLTEQQQSYFSRRCGKRHQQLGYA